MKTVKPENQEFEHSVGKSTLCRIDWKSWDKELPPKCTSIYIIIKLESGYYPVTGIYTETVIPAVDGVFPETKWKKVQFDDLDFPEIFIPPHNDDNYERLIAWGKLKSIIPLGIECEICHELRCIC